MKKITAIIAAVLATCTISATAAPSATAVSVPELSYQITICQTIKQKAHEMAECARWLGYGPDHIIITTAQMRWRDADTQEQSLTKALMTALGSTGAPGNK